MERRVFIAVLLSFIVLYTYQTFFAPPPPDLASTGAKPAATAPATTGGAAAQPAASVAAPSEPAPVALLGDAEAREITVETSVARIVFSNQGARAVRWELKNYRNVDGTPVDLIPSGLPDTEPRPF